MKHIFILIAVLMPLLCIAQKEDYVWVMGNNIIDFNTTPPTVRENGDFAPDFALTSISDRDGNLKYWRCGNYLYNRNGEVIYKFEGRTDYLNSISIIPFPNSEIKYLSLRYDTKKTKLLFSIIDGSKDELHPEIIDGFASLPISDEYGTPVVFQVKNQRNFWMMIENYEKFNVYSLSETGITLHSTIEMQPKEDYTWIDCINFQVVSPSQTKAFAYAMGLPEDMHYFYIEFDNENGLIKSITKHHGKRDFYTNFAFTRNEKYLYFTCCDDDGYKIVCDHNIYRCPVEKLSEDGALKKYRELVYAGTSDLYVEFFKLGPDGNIYFITPNTENLGVIYNPESDNPVVVEDGLKLAQEMKIKNLEAIFPFTFSCPSDFSYTVDCRDVAFSFSATDGYRSLKWDFGDGTPVVIDESNPKHTYDTYGKYNVHLTVDLNGSDTREFSAEVEVGRLITKPTIISE